MAGGGVAGVAAAITAARAGCRVALVERDNIIGGTAVSGQVGAICGLFRNGGSEPGELLNPGISAEIVAGLLAADPDRKFKKVGKVFILPYAPSKLAQLLESICLREQNLSLYPGATPGKAEVAGGRVTEVSVTSMGNALVFAPRVLIDCTGNGDLACLAGARSEIAPVDKLQLAGYIARVGGICQVDDSLSLKVPFLVAKGIEKQELPGLLRFTVFTPGDSPGEGFLKINLADSPENRHRTLDTEAGQLVSYLGRQLAEFRQAFIENTSEHIFPREGRRIVGSSLLTSEDVLSARKFSDGVVKGAWPLEIWNPENGVSYRYPPDNDFYEIPAGCLRADGFTNLFVAGRCISVTHEALGSTRVIGCCIALGEQAAKAAASLAKS